MPYDNSESISKYGALLRRTATRSAGLGKSLHLESLGLHLRPPTLFWTAVHGRCRSAAVTAAHADSQVSIYLPSSVRA
jgi:hypothetical protein